MRPCGTCWLDVIYEEFFHNLSKTLYIFLTFAQVLSNKAKEKKISNRE